MNWYLDVLKNKYAQFTGRARRTEYWMFFLINLIVAIVLSVVESIVGMGGILSTIYALAVLVPGVAVTIRRLHDTNRTGWWVLIGLVPVIGFIVLIVFAVLEGDAGDNSYGPNPKGAPAPA